MVETSRILGPDGQPVPRRGLTGEVVVPAVTGVRHVFDDVVAPLLNPGRLAAVLRAAAEGDLHDFLTLAEEMEEREFQYRSVLSTRKTAIKSIEPFVQAPTEDAEDVAIADAVKDELVRRPDFRPLVGALLDGLGKGYSVVEMLWRLDGTRWEVEAFRHRDPRLFMLDREDRRTIRVRSHLAPDGLPLAPFKYLVHVPDLKSGLPARNGLGRIAAWAYMLKSFTLRDWAQFLEIHGMPLRLGKYHQGASPADRRVLMSAVRDLGRDAAAIIPAGMEIEFIEVKGFSEKPFETMAAYLDKQVSKVIIGQTMTADDGSSKAQAAIHDKVRIDIKEDDAVDLAVTLNRDLVRPWVDLNFGPRPKNRYPVIVLPVLEREDMVALSRAISEMVDRGLEIEQAEVRDRMGFREPAPKARLMTPARSGGGVREPGTPPARTAAADSDDDDPERGPGGWRLDPRACPGCGALAVGGRRGIGSADGSPGGLSAAQGLGNTFDEPAGDRTEDVDAPDERDLVVEAALGDWERVMDPIRDALQAAFEAASSFEDLDARLAALAGTLPVDALAREIAILGMIGRGNGLTGETAPD